jgi:hypothetical protein
MSLQASRASNGKPGTVARVLAAGFWVVLLAPSACTVKEVCAPGCPDKACQVEADSQATVVSDARWCSTCADVVGPERRCCCVLTAGRYCFHEAEGCS